MSAAIWPPRLDAAALLGSGCDAVLGVSGMRRWSLFAGAFGPAALGSALPRLRPAPSASMIAAGALASAGRVCAGKLAEADDSTPPGLAPSACPSAPVSSGLACASAGLVVAKALAE